MTYYTYKELQVIAKRLGIKANAKKGVLELAVREALEKEEAKPTTLEPALELTSVEENLEIAHTSYGMGRTTVYYDKVSDTLGNYSDNEAQSLLTLGYMLGYGDVYALCCPLPTPKPTNLEPTVDVEAALSEALKDAVARDYMSEPQGMCTPIAIEYATVSYGCTPDSLEPHWSSDLKCKLPEPMVTDLEGNDTTVMNSLQVKCENTVVDLECVSVFQGQYRIYNQYGTDVSVYYAPACKLPEQVTPSLEPKQEVDLENATEKWANIIPDVGANICTVVDDYMINKYGYEFAWACTVPMIMRQDDGTLGYGLPKDVSLESVKRKSTKLPVPKPSTVERKNSKGEVLASAKDHKTYTGVPTKSHTDKTPSVTQAQLRTANYTGVHGNMSPRHQAGSAANLYANSRARKATPINTAVEAVKKVACNYTRTLGKTEQQALANLKQGANNIKAFAQGFNEGLRSGVNKRGERVNYNESRMVNRPKLDMSVMSNGACV